MHSTDGSEEAVRRISSHSDWVLVGWTELRHHKPHVASFIQLLFARQACEECKTPSPVGILSLLLLFPPTSVVQ